MNKLFTKIGVAFAGIAMAVGVGVAVGADHRAMRADAAQEVLTIDALSGDDTYFSWVADKNSGTAPAVSGGHVKLYVNNYLTISTSSNAIRTIDSVVIYCNVNKGGSSSKAPPSSFTPSVGSGNYTASAGTGKTFTFTTNSNSCKSLKLTVGGSKGNIEVITATVNYTLDATELATPTNFAQSNGVFTWNAVSNASSYTLIYDSNTITNINTNTYSVTNYVKGRHTAKVKAVGNGSTYVDSPYTALLEWDDTEYTDLPNGDYEVNLSISGSGETINNGNHFFVLKETVGTTIYRGLVLEYNGVSNQYNNEYTIAKTTGYIQTHNSSNATIKKVTIDGYISISSTMIVDDEEVTGVDKEATENPSSCVKEYEINSTDFKFQAGSDYNQSFYTMRIELNVGGKSEVLNRVVITKDNDAIKKSYTEGEAPSGQGLTATAYWRFEGEDVDSKSLDVTSTATWSFSVETMTTSTESFTATATYGGMDSASMTVSGFTVTKIYRYVKVDRLTKSLTEVGNASPIYVDWSEKSVTSTISTGSGAVYAGNTAKTLEANDYIQMRYNSSDSAKRAGIISTTSGGLIDKIVVSWNSGCTDGRFLKIFGNNTAYTAHSNLWDDSLKGTQLGTLTYHDTDAETEFVVSGNYKYIGFLSSDAIFINYIEIYWKVAMTSSDVEDLTDFSNGYLKMDTYHTDHVKGDTTGDNSCLGWFDDAKDAFDQLLSASQRYQFANSDDFADAWERFKDWSIAKTGKELSVDSSGTSQLSSRAPVMFVMNEQTNAVTIIVIISLVSLTAVGGYFLLKKKKEQ